MLDNNTNKIQVSVGVILPCFNSSKTIARALDSVCIQTVKVKVVYIYDDGSQDLKILESIINSYRNKLNIIFHSSVINHGPSMARNYFLGTTDVKYFTFLDSDDVWFKNKIEFQYNFMESNNAFLTGHVYSPLLKKNFIENNLIFKIKRLNVRNFLKGSPLFTPTIMIRNENLRCFNYNFRTSEDWLFCLENIILNSSENDCYFINNIMSAGFKQPIGFIGAGSSIRKCHNDRLKALKFLKKIGYLNLSQFSSSFLYENIKFPLRYIFYIKNRLLNLLNIY